MLSQVRAERLERREDHLIYQVTGPGGQSGEAALWCPESDQEPEGGPALGQISLIRMNETGDALEWTASLTLEGPPVLYGNSLGELTAVLEFSPSLRASQRHRPGGWCSTPWNNTKFLRGGPWTGALPLYLPPKLRYDIP